MIKEAISGQGPRHLPRSAMRGRARKWWAIAAAAAILPLFAVLGTKALVSGSLADTAGFEIDGNLQKDAGIYDWVNAGGSAGPTTCSSLLAGTAAAAGGPLSLSCARDAATGTSDNSISGKEGDASIQVVCGSIPNGKSDLSNFYVASQSAIPAGGTKPHSFLYLGWTINSTGGTADMDFEFNQKSQPSALQDGTAGHPCPSGNGETANVGADRSAGDFLVEYQFAAGGNSVSVKLTSWITSGTCATSGVTAPCWGLEKDLTNNGDALAAINDSSTVVPDQLPIANCPKPNTTPSKQSNGCVVNPLDNNNVLGPDQFGEAAIDLTNALNITNCETFGSAYLKSRSSATFTDALKDYIAPINVDITNCVTPPVTTSLSSSTSTFGDTVTDTATVSGFLGSNPPGGTVAFNVYKGSDATACTAANLIETAPSGASSDGTNGDSLTAGSAGPPPTATATETITQSGGLTPGNYEVQAVYTGDGGQNIGSSSSCGSEPLTINKKTPTLTTQDSPTTSITVGTMVNVSDTVTFSNLVSGVFPASTSTVTFTLYSDGSCTTSTGVTATVNPSGSSNTVSSGNLSFTPTATGTYNWGVSFSGDSNYNAVPSSGVQCGGTNETLTVVKASPTLVTQIALDDKVTIAGIVTGGTPAGTVTFELYRSSDCSGTLVANWTGVSIVNGVASTVGVTPTSGAGSNFVTNPTSPTSATTYSWKVIYSGDSLNNGKTVGCNTTNGDQETAAIAYTP